MYENDGNKIDKEKLLLNTTPWLKEKYYMDVSIIENGKREHIDSDLKQYSRYLFQIHKNENQSRTELT